MQIGASRPRGDTGLAHLQSLESRVLLAANHPFLSAALPQVAILPMQSTLWESKAGTSTHQGQFRLTRANGGRGSALSITLGLSGTAALGTNYVLLGPDGSVLSGPSPQVTIPEGQSSITLRVRALEDDAADPTLSIVVTVLADPNSASPSYAPYVDSSAISLNILDSHPSFTISAMDTGIQEGAANQTAFIVTRTPAPGASLAHTASTILLTFTGGSFDVANHLTAAMFSGTANQLDSSQTLAVTFASGQSRQSIRLTTSDDLLATGTQTILATLSGPADDPLPATSSASVNILDASPVVSITATVAAASEQSPSSHPGQLRIERAGDMASDLTVTIVNSTGPGFAVLGSSFQWRAHGLPLNSSDPSFFRVTLAKGQPKAVVRVFAIDDHTNDTLQVTATLADPGTGSGYTLNSQTSATVAITNYDRPPVIGQPAVPANIDLNSQLILSFDDIVGRTWTSWGTAVYHGSLQYRITKLSQGSLRVALNGAGPGVPAPVGTTLSPGDILIWTPPTDATATDAPAFSLRALDGPALSVDTAQFTVTIRSQVLPDL